MAQDFDSDLFDTDVAEFLKEHLELNPVDASFYGLTEYDDRLPDATASGFERREAATRSWLDRFSSYASADLTAEQAVDLALLRARLGAEEATSGFASWRRSPTTYLTNGVFELFMHGTRPEPGATAAAVARLGQVPATLSAGQENLDPALVDAELVRQWSIPQVAAQATFLRQGLADFVGPPDLRRQLEKAGAGAATAYEAYGEFLEGLADQARGSFVFGEEYYDVVLQTGEGFSFGARALREMGREQVELLDGQMAALAESMDGTADWRTVIERLRANHPSSMEEMLRYYREETERAREFVRAEGLMSFPEGEECAVEPSPLFARAGVPVASYFPPAYFGPPSKGTFNVPFTPDDASEAEQEARLRSNSFFEIPAVTAHEAYPGHHLHIAVAQGSNALRQVLTSTYMVEGWGLYSEQLMGQHGFYSDAAARLGQLSMRLFRAGRIVVDTSLHLGEMGMAEATAFMSERCGFPELTAHREVLRYCARPTQASAYLTGALEIERLAGEWTSAGMGTLTDFHDALAESGKLPLGVAAQAIGLAGRTG
jgi:uncharacterized protein (DUF885 family)